jgi:hypothetical protein
MRVLGYCNHGGTLDVAGMLFANGCTWAHLVTESADLLHIDKRLLLDESEIAAIEGQGDPSVLQAAGFESTQ